MSWHKKELDKTCVRKLMELYKIDALAAAILSRRGLESPEQAKYILEDKPLFLHNPFLLPDMDKAVERLAMAIEEREKTLIFGDRDADGLCGAALLAQYLQKRQLPLEAQTPLGDEPYGLNLKAVEAAAQQGATLIVCIDNGSSALEPIEKAADLGIDVIVLDHHEVAYPNLPAAAFVNPKRGGYPNAGLSASAVVLKTLFALEWQEAGYFNAPVCLLHVEADQNGAAVEAMRVINLKESRRARFVFGPGSADGERFLDFASGSLLCMYDAPPQIALLGRLFGADVYAQDLKEKLKKSYSSFERLSLKELAQKSSLFKFNGQADVLDALLALYRLSLIEDPALFAHYRAGFDLAAVGLLADIMPLLDENRLIVKRGLKLLNHNRRPALEVLLARLGLLGASRVSEQDVSWKLAPLLNASGRMGRADIALEALLSPPGAHLQQLAESLAEMNSQRKELSGQWQNTLRPAAEASHKKYNGQFVFLYDSQLPRGLTGLLAGLYARLYKCTAIVAAACADGLAVGSLRSNQNGRIALFFQTFEGLFIDKGGHQRAGGFSISQERLEQLERGLPALAKKAGAAQPEEEVFIDAEVPLAALNLQLAQLVRRFEPYGEAFSPLLFATRGLILESVALMGKNEEHARLTLAAEGCRWPAVWWRAAEQAARFSKGDKVDILYNIKQDNGYNNMPRLEIIGLQAAAL